MRGWTGMLYAQNTSLWAHGRSPAGEEHVDEHELRPHPGRRSVPLHLPVSHPVIRSVFTSISVSFSSPPSLSRSLSEVLAGSVRDEKKTKCLLIQQSYVTAVSNSVTLITPPKTHQPRGISQISRPLNANTAVLMHKVWTDWLNRIDATSLPSPHPPSFMFCLFLHISWNQQDKVFQIQPTACPVKGAQIKYLLYDLHAMLHQWQR